MRMSWNRSQLASTGSNALPATALRHLQATPEAIREDQDTNTLIVPMVAIREGVFQCANCPSPEFYPATEFGRYPESWNDRMVTIDHPKLAGRFVSAGTTGVWERSGIGRIRNARLDGKKLKAEAHIDLAKVAALGTEALELVDLIVGGESIDVSIAAFVDPVAFHGTHEGRNFTAVQTNYVPDHVAILPSGTRGACSFEDGCGVPRVNKACACTGDGECQCGGKIEPASAELADNDRRELLNAALAKVERDFFWIIAVFDTHVVYRTENEQTFSRDFTIDEDTGAVTLSDEAIEGTIVTEFMPIKAEEEETMGREAAVEQLVASSATGWGEGDKAFLMELSDDHFAKLAAGAAGSEGDQTTGEPAASATPANQVKEPATADDVADPALDLPKQPAASAAQEEDPVALYINAAPEPVRQVLRDGIAQLDRARSKYIEHISANSANQFSQEELETMDTDQLRKLAQFAGPARVVDSQPATASSFAGQAPRAAANGRNPSFKPLPDKPAWPTK